MPTTQENGEAITADFIEASSVAADGIITGPSEKLDLNNVLSADQIYFIVIPFWGVQLPVSDSRLSEELSQTRNKLTGKVVNVEYASIPNALPGVLGERNMLGLIRPAEPIPVRSIGFVVHDLGATDIFVSRDLPVSETLALSYFELRKTQKIIGGQVGATKRVTDFLLEWGPLIVGIVAILVSIWLARKALK
jgi:hypothetical protein